jgi:hypothetical protein
MVRQPMSEHAEMNGQWCPLSIEEVADRFSSVATPWWIAGGYAIDLLVGWETRQHDDLDIEMFRKDRGSLVDAFPGWDLYSVGSGGLVPWEPGSTIAPHVFGIWGRPAADAPWAIEVMLANGGEKRWRFRRDPDISLETGSLIRRTAEGIPYCTPEVQMLYKSKMARPKDDVDMARVLHRMTVSQRVWLADAIRRGDADHPWIELLEMANERHHE